MLDFLLNCVFFIPFGKDEKDDDGDGTCMAHYIVPGVVLNALEQVFSALAAYWNHSGSL